MWKVTTTCVLSRCRPRSGRVQYVEQLCFTDARGFLGLETESVSGVEARPGVIGIKSLATDVEIKIAILGIKIKAHWPLVILPL